MPVGSPPEMSSPDPARAALIEAFAREMLTIFLEHRHVRYCQADISSLAVDDAYHVQEAFIRARVAGGEHPVGWKIGCTSRAIQEQFGLSQPIYGRLMAPFLYPDGADVPVSLFTDCAVEPELVFHIGADLEGDVDEATARDSIAGVSAGIELHNYRFWRGQPTVQELIASNGIHAALVTGKPLPLTADVDLNLEGVGIFLNQSLAASGIGAEIMGGPLASLCWLVRLLAKRHKLVRSGEIVIPGSAVRLVRVEALDVVQSCFTHFGTCSVRLV